MQLVVGLEKHFGLKIENSDAAKGILESVETIAREIEKSAQLYGILPARMKALSIFLLKLVLTGLCLWWAFSQVKFDRSVFARPGARWITVGSRRSRAGGGIHHAARGALVVFPARAVAGG